MSICTLMTIATSLPIGRCYRLGRCLAVVAVVFSLVTTTASAAENGANNAAPPTATLASSDITVNDDVFCNGIRLQDEIVVVNVRNLCGCCDPERIRSGLIVEDYAVCDDRGRRNWQKSDLQSFLAFDPSVPTVIFVHGNQISPGDAKLQGAAVYRQMIRYGCVAPKIRFVIFSWPASQINGLLHDVRVKAARTGPAGCQLAWLIDQMPAETPISLAGFSFGARIITGGLHILSGGSLGGTCVLNEHVHPNRPPMSVIMMASALHSYWLAEGQYHGQAMSQVSRMCLINNCADNAMKYYDFIEPGFGGPQALGLCGPTCIGRESARKIVNRDVSCSVGSEHQLMYYICAPGDAAFIWNYTAGAAASERESGG